MVKSLTNANAYIPARHMGPCKSLCLCIPMLISAVQNIHSITGSGVSLLQWHCCCLNRRCRCQWPLPDGLLLPPSTVNPILYFSTSNRLHHPTVCPELSAMSVFLVILGQAMSPPTSTVPVYNTLRFYYAPTKRIQCAMLHSWYGKA